MKIFLNPEKKDWPPLLQRPELDYQSLSGKVSAILTEIRLHGDAAVKKYCSLFDGVDLQDLRVSSPELEQASDLVSIELKEAIALAKSNITRFHESQLVSEHRIETMPGVDCWRQAVAIEKVGLYIPGGTAPLFSTLLMLGIPATIAGCKEIVVCTPPDKNGNINPVILYVAHLLGIQNVFKIGGVQAVAAMAYGTASVPKVYKIFGPGNQYVTCAKQLVNAAGTSIDMPAGPSEIAIFADETSTPAFVASDLLSQAEHGTDSQVLLVSASHKVLNQVVKEVELQLEQLPRKEIAAASLRNSRFVLLDNIDQAFEMLNDYAAEHLIIASENANPLAERVINAGSVFLGHYSPESVGDYASDTNHTLPTNGNAKAYSGVSVDSFVKKITFQQLSKAGLQNIGTAVELMAEAEGLQAHRNAVSIRLTAIKN